MKSIRHFILSAIALTGLACGAKESPCMPEENGLEDALTWLAATEPERYGALSVVELGSLDVIRIDGSERPGSVDPLLNEEPLRHLAALPALKSLAIWGTRISNDGLAIIGQITGLETLEIGGWGVRYDDEGLESLLGLSGLHALKLTQAPEITDESMKTVAQLPALKQLDITYTKISDLGLAHLLAAENLETVAYGWARETERWREAFQAAHPNHRFELR